MIETEHNEIGDLRSSKSLSKRVLEKLDHYYTPNAIRQIYERNNHLWHIKNTEDFIQTLDTWINEIRYGTEENKGLEGLKGQIDRPHISIVIPIHNEERTLLQILQSIATQDYDGGIEVIVVDNNSSTDDRGAQFAEKCGAKVIKYTLPEHSPDKKLSQIALARQKGLEAARGNIIISTDGDVIAPREWVRLMSEPLDTNPNIAVVAGPIAHYDRGDKPRVIILDILSQQTKPLKAGKLNSTDPEQISSTSTKGVTLGANMAFRKADAKEISGYDTRIYPGEDTNIGLRLLRLGKIKYLKSAGTTIRVSPRRYADTTVIQGLKKMIQRGVDSETMLYTDELRKPIHKR